MLPCMFAHASRSCFWDPEHLPASSQCQKGLSPARLWGIYGLYWIHNFFKCVGYSIMFQNSGVSEENPVFWMITRLLWHVWWIIRLLDHNPLFCGVWVPQVYIYIYPFTNYYSVYIHCIFIISVPWKPVVIKPRAEPKSPGKTTWISL